MRSIRLSILIAVLFATACSDFATAPDRTPSEVRVSPDTVLLTEGDSVRLEVEVLDQHGEVYPGIPGWSPPHWTSRSPDVIALDEKGVARAMAGGETRAEVEIAGLTTEAVVRANPSELQVSVPFVHVTQSVQRRDGDVPLVADRPGLLRVYVQGGGPNFFQPVVRATFHNGGEVVHSAELTLENAGLPVTVTEGELTWSYDQEIPASVMQPGLGVSIEVDPDGIVPSTQESVLRVPTEGSLALEVREVRPFWIRMVPVDQALLNMSSGMNLSLAERVLQLTRDIFPFDEFDLDVRDPYVTEADLRTPEGWYQLIQEIATLRFDDGSPRYYYGAFNRPSGTSIGGLGYIGYPVAIGMQNRPDVIAHEIGHTLNLPHAPCGGAEGVDPSFPYRTGSIGQHGFGGTVTYGSGVSYDPEDQRLHIPVEEFDLMSYCDPIWISDYNYEKVMTYRETSEHDEAFEDATDTAERAPEQEVLLVRGGIHEGRVRVEPALEWIGRPVMPEQGGPYTLEGLDADGGTLFSLSFRPAPLDRHGAQFLVALPREMARVEELATLRVRGPAGVAERIRSSPARGVPEVAMEPLTAAAGQGGRSAAVRWDPKEHPLAVVRDRETGQIRAMSRTGSIRLPEADTTRFEVVLSDGVGSRTARVVQR